MLVASVVAVACGSAPTEPPGDLILTNGRVNSGLAAPTLHEALAVRGDRIVAVGTNADIGRMRGPSRYQPTAWPHLR